eukprot:c47197_g1_i1.p1 GENE.c47197_g1_i1~~c47197_g1_i1.p1  ORF type:complete len:177 (+),score=49.69 c47197_g1_i1:64-531(+)
MWSVGVVMYMLLCGFPPFTADSYDALFTKICKGQFKFLSPYWDLISDEAKDLICHLIEVDTAKRYTADEALTHKWFQSLVGKSPSSLPSTPEAPVPELDLALDQLRVYTAYQKLKRGVLAVVALNRIRISLLGDSPTAVRLSSTEGLDNDDFLLA